MDNKTFSILEALNVNKITLKFLRKREVPKNNLYWNVGDYYIGKNTKFMIIPLFYELFQRVSKINNLLLFKYIEVLEELLNNTESEEMKIITYNECVNKCKNIHEIVEKSKNNPLCAAFIEEIILKHPKQEALRRGNFMLYYFLLHYKDDSLDELKTISYLFLDFVSCGLIIDDFLDTDKDIIENEPNTINELGGGMKAMKKVEKIYKKASSNVMAFYPELKIYYDNLYTKSVSYFLSNLKLW